MSCRRKNIVFLSYRRQSRHLLRKPSLLSLRDISPHCGESPSSEENKDCEEAVRIEFFVSGSCTRVLPPNERLKAPNDTITVSLDT